MEWALRAKGKLVSWNEEKAFGFISPLAGGTDIFIHISAFANRKVSPSLNEIVTYTPSKGKDGKPCAKNAIFPSHKVNLNQTHNSVKNKFSIYLACIFLAIITLACLLKGFSREIVITYWILSIVTFTFYAIDKNKAKKGKWRTQESTLHMLSIVGGWPGAALAQQFLRHKSQKTSFRFSFWCTVIANLTVLSYWFNDDIRYFINPLLGI